MEPINGISRARGRLIRLVCVLALLLAACGPETSTKRVIDKRIDQERTQLGTPVALIATRYLLTIQECPNDGARCTIYEVEVSKWEWERTEVQR